MSYGASFNPMPPSDARYNPALKGNRMVDPNNSLLPKCGDLAQTKNRIAKEWEHFIDHFGFRIFYQQSGNNIDTLDYAFGENPTKAFKTGRIVKGFLDPNGVGSTPLITDYGLTKNIGIEIYITIMHFYEVFGKDQIPNMGDIFFFMEDNCDSPEKVKPIVYKITYKDRMNFEDFLFGDYVWKLTATRADYSFEPNMSNENSTPLNDSTFSGVLSSNDPLLEVTQYKGPKNNAEKEALKEIIPPNSKLYGNFR